MQKPDRISRRVYYRQWSYLLSWSLDIGSCPNADYAEARTIYEGLKQAHLLGKIGAQLFTNSQLLWQNFAHQNTDTRYDWCHLFHICWDLLSTMYVYFVKLLRNYNRGSGQACQNCSQISNVCHLVGYASTFLYSICLSNADLFSNKQTKKLYL